METPESSQVSKLDVLSHEIRTKRGELGSAKQVGGSPQSSTAVTAESKLRAYRDRSTLLRAYNRSTERVFDQSETQTTPHTIVPNGNGVGAHNQEWTPTSAMSATADLRMESAVYSSRGDNPLSRLTRVNRTLQARIKMLEQENERYKNDVRNMVVQVDGITDESVTTDQNVANLMDDLHMERNNHEKARNKLEAKSREVEIMRRDLAEKAAYVEQKDMELQEQAMRLAALESESREAHRKNVELSAKIEEVLAVHEEFVARADAVGTDDGAGGEGADAEALAEREALLKRLQKAEAATKLKAGQLEAVNARADRACRELALIRGARARGGGLMKLIKAVWNLMMVIGWGGFVGFLYLLVAEDALRPRGVDVYRYAT